MTSAQTVTDSVAVSARLLALVTAEERRLAAAAREVEAMAADFERVMAQVAADSRGARQAGGEVIAGLDAVRRRMESLAEQTRSEVLTLVPGGGQTVESLAASEPLDRSALARGVQLRTIYLTSAVADPLTRRHVLSLQQVGAAFRTLPSLPLRMLVADREVALVPLDMADSDRGALVLRSPAALNALVALFEACWSQASEFSRPETGPGELTPYERQAIDMLAGGARDEDIATALGLSSRSVRRVVAGLMERLGANSRFQAGALALRAGWIAPSARRDPALPLSGRHDVASTDASVSRPDMPASSTP